MKLRPRAAWDLTFTALLVVSVAIAVWYDASEDAATREVLAWLDLAFVALFLGEWLVRVARQRSWRYGARHLWELAGMVPVILPLPPMLRAVRLLRLVRLLRVFDRLGRKLRLWERIARESSLRTILTASAVIAVVGSLLVWLLERGHHPDRPMLDHYSEWLWWAVVTVTTVGYGDITPVTASGRVVAAVLMVTGIGTIGLLASNIASALVAHKGEEEAAADAVAPGSAGAAAGRASGLVAELDRLARLREEGHLTDDEFARAKQALLG